MPETIVIAGAGHCAGQAVVSLRQGGFGGRLVVIGDEPHHPYQRPPLSKKYLAGELGLDRVYFRPDDFYAGNGVELRLGMRVDAIDRAAQRIQLGGGETLEYDRLLLATGSRPRSMPVPGTELAGVCYLRTLADVEGIRERMGEGNRLVVVGGGYIGLEVASVGVEAGMRVTLLEMADRVLNRVTAPEMSEFYTHAHRERGVDLRCNARVTGFGGDGRIERVMCEGESIDADVVVIGIGVLPNEDLAQAAGLACDNGIVVDEYCRTADEHIYAAGDCTNHPNAFLDRRLRLESVQNAIEQARAAAANLCGGELRYAPIPWFWSDQYDLKLQILGISEGYDQLVQRGSMRDEAFALFYLRAGVLIAVDAVNMPREFMACRKLIPERPRIAPERLADTRIPIQEM